MSLKLASALVVLLCHAVQMPRAVTRGARTLSKEDRSRQIDEYVERQMKDLSIPGLSLAVIRDGKVIKLHGYGLANVENSVAATPETAYLLASMTKQFTAAAIMILEEEGKLALDDPVSKYLQEPADAWKEITIRELLGHTAGLKDRFEEETLDANKWRRAYSTREMYEAARNRPLDFAPGTGWQYSDQGYFLLGMIIERVTGQTYRDFLKKRIFEPLGMTASTTLKQREIVPHMASGYALAGDRLIHNHRNMDFGMTSHFGMISTVTDLVKWDAALRERKLLGSKSYDLMWAPVSLKDGSRALGPAGAYGFGWFLDRFRGHRLVFHGGATGTAILRLPDDGLTVIVLTNLELLAGGNAPGIARDIAAMFIPQIDWAQLKESPDPDPKLTERLREELGNLAAGKPDFSLYVPQAAAEMRKQIEVIKATYSQLGKVEQLAFCESEMDGASRSIYYKLKCEAIPTGFFIRYTFNEKGEIAYVLSSTQ